MFTDECPSAGGNADRGDREPRAGALSYSTHHPDVLIVEDERVARRALSALLSASGYAPKAAESAEEALRMLGTQPAPRVALVDLNLPGMSGLDFIRRLGQLNPTVRAVLMTAAGEETLMAALRDHDSAVHYLRKPLDFQRLLTVIAQDQAAH